MLLKLFIEVSEEDERLGLNRPEVALPLACTTRGVHLDAHTHRAMQSDCFTESRVIHKLKLTTPSTPPHRSHTQRIPNSPHTHIPPHLFLWAHAHTLKTDQGVTAGLWLLNHNFFFEWEEEEQRRKTMCGLIPQFPLRKLPE